MMPLKFLRVALPDSFQIPPALMLPAVHVSSQGRRGQKRRRRCCSGLC